MNVKVCDVQSETFKKDFVESLKTTGFAVLTNHGVSDEIISDAQTAWRSFFTSEQEYKDTLINPKDGNMGYKGMQSETALGSKKADLKEFFHWRPYESLPFETIQETVSIFYRLEDLGIELLAILDEEKLVDWSFEKACLGSDNTILRTLYYPAMDFSQANDAVRAAAHEDINFITLLVAATAPGLQVKDLNGNWHDVPHAESSIVVNVGDQLQLATNGRLKSTTHRVINPDNSVSDRISMPLFIHPHSDTVLSGDTTAGDFLADRIAAIYGAK